jgi:hypothetical protein
VDGTDARNEYRPERQELADGAAVGDAPSEDRELQREFAIGQGSEVIRGDIQLDLRSRVGVDNGERVLSQHETESLSAAWFADRDTEVSLAEASGEGLLERAAQNLAAAWHDTRSDDIRQGLASPTRR